MKSILSVLAFCLSISFFGSGIGALAPSAEANSVSSNLSQACQGDVQKYCSDVTHGNGRIMACLRAHDDKLSSGCSKQWTQAKTQFKKNMKAMHTACSGDVRKFCSNATDMQDIGNCLNDHASDLSASCKDFREQNKMAG